MPLKALRVIANGVDLERFVPPARPRERGLIVFAGRLVPQKGVDIAVQAFAVVTRRLPDARLVVAGDGYQRLYLKRLARHLGSRAIRRDKMISATALRRKKTTLPATWAAG